GGPHRIHGARDRRGAGDRRAGAGRSPRFPDPGLPRSGHIGPPHRKAMSGYTIDLASVWSRRDMLLSGLLMTAELWVVALALGLAGGLIVGLGRLSHRKVLAWPSSCVIETFRGTPPLVQLFWFYYCLPLLFGLRLSALTTAIVSL